GFGYDKVRALLAYLAVEAEHSHRRDALAGLLWPDQPEAVARKSLRVALSTLRQTLGDAAARPPFLLISRDTIQFNPASDYTLDVTSFTNLLHECERHSHPAGTLCEACTARLAQAVALYRGDFLHQISVRDSMAFEEWALLMRERLHR